MNIDNRIVLKLPKRDKELLEKAAKLSNLSLPEYIIKVALKQAKIDISKMTIVLNNNDRDNLIEVLNSSDQPNKSLKNLFK